MHQFPPRPSRGSSASQEVTQENSTAHITDCGSSDVPGDHATAPNWTICTRETRNVYLIGRHSYSAIRRLSLFASQGFATWPSRRRRVRRATRPARARSGDLPAWAAGDAIGRAAAEHLRCDPEYQFAAD